MLVRAADYAKMRCPLNGWQPCLGPTCGHFRAADGGQAYCGSGGPPDLHRIAASLEVIASPPAASAQRIERETTKGSAPQKRR